MSTAISIGPVWRVLGVLLLVAAVVCGVLAAVTWEDLAVEGAYMNRSAVAVISGVTGGYDTGRILLGAAIGLAAAGILVLLVSLIQARKRADPPNVPC
jgi:hypothetical protein